jgi:hypothetical protein
VLHAADTLFGIDSETWQRLFEHIVERWQEYGQFLSIKTTDVKSFAEIEEEAQRQMARMSLVRELENGATNTSPDQVGSPAATG